MRALKQLSLKEKAIRLQGLAEQGCFNHILTEQLSSVDWIAVASNPLIDCLDDMGEIIQDERLEGWERAKSSKIMSLAKKDYYGPELSRYIREAHDVGYLFGSLIKEPFWDHITASGKIYTTSDRRPVRSKMFYLPPTCQARIDFTIAMRKRLDTAGKRTKYIEQNPLIWWMDVSNPNIKEP